MTLHCSQPMTLTSTLPIKNQKTKIATKHCKNTTYSLGCKSSAGAKLLKSCKTLAPKYTAQVANTLQVQNYTKSCKTLAPK